MENRNAPFDFIKIVTYLWNKACDTFISFVLIFAYFSIIIFLSGIFSYIIMSSVFQINLNMVTTSDFNIPKCLLFLIVNTFLVFLLSIVFNCIYIHFNKNEWVYTVINAFLLVMTSSVIFIVLGLNSTIETYVINEFKNFIDQTKYTNVNIDDAVYMVKALYNMFIYWISSTIITFNIAFTLINNNRKNSVKFNDPLLQRNKNK